MSAKRREVIVAPVAVRRMHECRPTEDELEAIKNVLASLRTDPGVGYKIAFHNPELFRVDVGRFRVHYSVGDDQIGVSFIGVY